MKSVVVSLPRRDVEVGPALLERRADQGEPGGFVEKNGLRYAGTHLLIDLWDAKHLESLAAVETTMRAAVEACGATLLNLHLHHFEPNGGVSGVAVLAESHISIHTWPERGFAAVDIFTCGDCDPYKAVPVFKAHFRPGNVQLSESKRGLTT